MRGAAKHGNPAAFLASFGRADDPFPTLLAGSLQMFACWQEGREREGILRYLLSVECERLMGLPEGWTAYGHDGQVICDSVRYRALGNAIALPCAEYIMAGIRDVSAK